MPDRPPLPPFDRPSALIKVQAAEDGWNTRDPERVAGAYTEDSAWRNRDSFFTGRAAIIEFLTATWDRELDGAPARPWGERWREVHPRYVTHLGPDAATIGPPPARPPAPATDHITIAAPHNSCPDHRNATLRSSQGVIQNKPCNSGCE